MVNDRMVSVYRNNDICSECGGQCCKIYTSPEHGGSYPEGIVWFEEFCEFFHLHAERYNVEPLFDPLIVNASGNEHMLEDLERNGIDPHACQYLGQHGCRIRWDLRPLQCRTFACEQLKCEQNIVETIDGSCLSPY